LSAVEVIDAALARSRRVDIGLLAFTQVWPEVIWVHQLDHELDRRRAHGHSLALVGVKVGEGLDLVPVWWLLGAGWVLAGATVAGGGCLFGARPLRGLLWDVTDAGVLPSI
jgi:hypothetical protein